MKLKLPLHTKVIGGKHQQVLLFDADSNHVATIHPAKGVHELRQMKREDVEELKRATGEKVADAVNNHSKLIAMLGDMIDIARLLEKDSPTQEMESIYEKFTALARNEMP